MYNIVIFMNSLTDKIKPFYIAWKINDQKSTESSIFFIDFR